MLSCSHSRRLGRLALFGVFATLLALLTGSSSALAATAAPGWVVSSLAEPTNLSAGDNARCETREVCDAYSLLVRNAGGAASDGTPVVIKDTLPAGVVAKSIIGHDLQSERDESESAVGVVCTLSPLQCTDDEPVPAGDVIHVMIHVTLSASGTASVTNRAEVEGGGGGVASTEEPTTVANTLNGEPTAFGIQDLSMTANALDGSLDTQAGDHPNSVTVTVDPNTILRPSGELNDPLRADVTVQEPKTYTFDLPLGQIGDPQATPQCPEADLGREALCPAASQIGTVVVSRYGIEEYSGQQVRGQLSNLYNMVPENGYPAVFGFKFISAEVIVYASVVWTSEGYRVRVTAPNIPHSYHGYQVNGTSLTFFGDPAEADGAGNAPAAFFRNPTDCGAPASALSLRMTADSWVNPGDTVEKTSLAYPSVTGCDMLQFNPGLEVSPDVTQADEPAGYTVDLRLPQAGNVAPLLGSPDLKSASVTLPEGVSISPSAADGLGACSDAQFALESTEPSGCPAASQVATVTASTPILSEPVTGQVFLGAPLCGSPVPCTEEDARDGRMLRMFMQVGIPGASLKFPGTVSVDPGTGRLTAHFEGLLQQPIGNVRLQLKGGPRAPLANPQTCGTVATTSDLVPWSSPATPDASPFSSFNVDWDGNGGACPAGMPFAPEFNAGTVTSAAGGFSPFTLTVSRHDREQDLSGVSVQLPPGLLGLLKSVSLCSEPQAAQGACGAGSQIGVAHAAAGAGSHPFWTEGRVYLTGPYKGAPFGLSIVVPAVAGPFNLGNVVVRAAIHVNPTTSAITVTSDPLPQILDGVPLRVQTVNVTVDRSGFIFNPTNCAQQQVTGTVTAAQGATASVSSPFAVAGCAGLPFKPSFAVSTQAKTSKQSGASLTVKGKFPAGDANVHSVGVVLPKQLPARLTTIQQACPQATFAANPASCPVGSDIGTATAVTPVLASAVVGPVYLVSHGGAAFPDVVAILQAEGVTVDLTGSISIKKGITSSDFAMVPDVPISSFTLSLPEGPHSGLAAVVPAKAKGDMCGQALTMPFTITGQNGAVVKQNAKIAVTGCPKPKKKAKATQRAYGKKHRRAKAKKGSLRSGK